MDEVAMMSGNIKLRVRRIDWAFLAKKRAKLLRFLDNYTKRPNTFYIMRAK